MKNMLLTIKLKIILIIVLFLILATGIFLALMPYREQGEIAYFKSLAQNHPQGETFVQELLAARKELKDGDRSNDFQAYLRMGINLNLLGDKKRALKAYEQALKLNGNNILALNNVANIYNDLGDYRMSESYWLRLIELYPNQPTFYRQLGYLYRYRLNKTPNEIEAFFRVGLAKTNHHPDLLTWLISYFQEIGDNERFVEYANQLIDVQKKP